LGGKKKCDVAFIFITKKKERKGGGKKIIGPEVFIS